DARPNAAKFDLCFSFADTADGVSGSLEYSADLFDLGTAQAISDRFLRLLAAAAADPTAPLHRQDVLAHEERERLLIAFNDTSAAAVPRDLLVDMFERRARASAQASALVSAHRTLSYEELSVRARSLAWRLIERGAGPERFVALFLDRSEELVVAVL